MPVRAGRSALSLTLHREAVEAARAADGQAAVERADGADGSEIDFRVGGRVEEMPAVLLDQLKDGGRLVAVMGTTVHARAVIWRRIGSNFDVQETFEAAAPMLPGFAKAKTFVF